MFERLPFEIPRYVSLEDMAFVLDKTVKGVKAQATREQWGRRILSDGSNLWAVAEMPLFIRDIVVAKLLERDGRQNDFCLLVAKEFAVAVRSFPYLRNCGYSDEWFEAALWCRRLEMVDDIMTYIPRHNFTAACVSVAYATSIGWHAGVDRLISFTKPLTGQESPILELDRRFWLPVILDRLQNEEIAGSPQRQQPARVIPFTSPRKQAEAQR